MGLDKSTVSIIVKEFTNLGIVESYQLDDEQVALGRRPLGLRVASDFGCVLGVGAQPDLYTVVALDLAGSETYRAQFAPESERLVPAVCAVVRRVLADPSFPGTCLLGLGVGLSGMVDPVGGIVKQSLPFGQDSDENVAVGDELKAVFGLPVIVDNDANCCAWGVLTDHRTGAVRNYLCVLIELHKQKAATSRYDGLGVGFGIGIDGRVYGGTQHAAGEFRSVFSPAEKSSQFSISRTDSFRVAEDPALFSRFSEELSTNIALLVNTFDLSHIFVDGNIETGVPTLIRAVEDAIQRNWAYSTPRLCHVEFTGRGEHAVANGAGSMFLQRLFLEPEYGTDLAGMNDWLRSVVVAGQRDLMGGSSIGMGALA